MIGVLNLTIDRAPTRPIDKANEDLTTEIIKTVLIATIEKLCLVFENEFARQYFSSCHTVIRDNMETNTKSKATLIGDIEISSIESKDSIKI